MEVTVVRLGDNGDSTVGVIYIDGILRCGSIEDEERAVKVRGETRIPCGKYQLGLRNVGSFHRRYKERYGDFHKGMVCIYNAPNWTVETENMSFQYILLHTGNTDDHTAGCLLPNSILDFRKNTGSRSAAAYMEIYPEIASAIQAYEDGLLKSRPTITYIDIETGK